MTADPLTPAVQVERVSLLVAGPFRVAHEPQVRLEAKCRQRLSEAVDATRDAAGACVAVGALEREDVELQGGSSPRPGLESVRDLVFSRMRPVRARSRGRSLIDPNAYTLEA
jgi:hypothetical protein